jgi:hypothetical protein
VHVEKDRILVAALGSCWEKKQISAVTVVLLLGEKKVLGVTVVLLLATGRKIGF